MNIPTILVIVAMVILTIHQWRLKKRGWAYAFATMGLILIGITVLQHFGIIPQRA